MSEEEAYAFLGVGGAIIVIIISVIYMLTPIIMMIQLWRINANIKEIKENMRK